MQQPLPLLAALLLAPLAALHAAEAESSSAPRDDAAWLQQKGTLVFHDTFNRPLDGNGITALGNGWESATADRAPDVKQADLDHGILKINSDGKAAGHGVHIHHDAGFGDGGTTLRFRFPGLNKGETFTIGHVDREMQGVHAGHLCYANLYPSSILLRDNKTGISDEKLRARRAVFLEKKEKLPADLDALLQMKEKTTPWKADNEWHDLTLAFEGDEMRLSIDGKLVASHRSEGFAHPTKRWLSFSAANTVWISDVKIWTVPDPKKIPGNKPIRGGDPALEQFGIFEKTAPNPQRISAIATKLPLVFKKGDRIAFVGNTLLDRAQEFGNFEAMIQLAHPQLELVIRDFAWSADEPDLQPRPENFATLKQHLTREKMDVVIAAFGFNESFGGMEKIADFKARLAKWVEDVNTSAFDGKTAPRIVLLSPTANENLPGVPAADLNNIRLAAYTEAMAEVAAEQKVGFVDLFNTAPAAVPKSKSKLTINGVHLTAEGDALVSAQLFQEMFGTAAPTMNEELRAAVVDKNRQYFRRYRPLNSFYYTGGRNKEYGYLDFLPAMRNFEIMTANRDERIWQIARGISFPGRKVDDSNVPPLEGVSEARGANEWLSPADELKSFRVDPRFEVTLFASEEQFPELAKPIQMRWDARGRLWVSCSTTYPHVYPGDEPHDKIVILEDTKHSGKADKCTVWADGLQIPLAFELTKNGVYVSEEPHLTLLTDTDGSGKANQREHILTGFGCEDSHHALHDLVWTPDGDLMFRESIFHHSQVETPYGPVRMQNSGWFVFTPATQRLTTFGNYPSTNPWGVTFDDWGNHVASHPIFATAFQATNPPYPHQHPAAGKLPAYSGVCGQEFVDFPMWPKEMQGGFIKVRYKPTNKVEIHDWIEKEDHYEEKFVSDLIFSENLSFIPTDVRFGPRGDLYICDWYNPVKGHAQYSLRDPRRDRKSGRIWRVLPKNTPLQDPPPIAGAPIAALLENLKRPEYRYRYWTRREIRERDPAEVATALDAWVAALDKNDPRFRHHQTEAVWAFRNVGAIRPALLTELLSCDEHHARAAATHQLRHWHAALPEDGAPLLAASARDANGIVRMEAVIAASYIGTRAALDAVLPVMHSAMGDHLRYATICALESEALQRHWKDDPALTGMITGLIQGAAKTNKMNIIREPQTPEEIAFEKQPGMAMVEISSVPERMIFTPTEFAVKPGQPVKLIFSNPDAMQHNLAILAPGSLEEVGMAGNEMAKDPDGIKKDFLPNSDKVLHATKLVNPNSGAVLRFTAPEQPGVYPFVCTFPGHWIIMNGKMTVK